jgi:acetate---CoA ligase (ADP-forming) subunit alpha
MDDMSEHPLYGMLHPRSIAFWGASSNPTSMGSFQLRHLLDLGFEGKVYPIHPREKEIMGLPAFTHVKDVPGPVDLAVFVLPTRVVPEILEECGMAGIKRVVVVSGGFAEMGSEEGKELQKHIAGIARKYGIRMLGPNCIGVVNPYMKLNTTICVYDARPGFIGMGSQSGSFVTQMFTHLNHFGLGFSQAISVGNEADIDLTDCLEYLSLCPNTKVIGLYVESIRRGRDFVRVAKEVSKKKPIVAHYVGGSESGSRAALSHTGALGGPDELYDGIFKQCGIIRARTSEELFDFCFVLGTQPPPTGNRVAILTHSGGPGAAAADAAERSGLAMAQLSPKTLEGLSALVPGTGSMRNPVDLTFYRNPEDYTETIPATLLDDSGVDSLFMYLLLPSHRVAQVIRTLGATPEEAVKMAYDFVKGQASLVVSLTSRFGKPIVGGSYCMREDQFTREIQDMGVPVLPSPERAVKALAALSRYGHAREALLSESGV